MTELVWTLSNALLVGSFWPGSRWRVVVLRAFGARIGKGVVVKPYLKVKFPWRLRIGDYAWLGEHVWIDNLAQVDIGDHACVSQGAYLCTGSHDWRQKSFDLITRPIILEDGAWVGAMARVAPGVRIGYGAVLTFGSVATNDLPEMTICTGNPAIPLKHRRIQTDDSPIQIGSN